MIIEKQEDVTRKVLEEMHRTPDARTKEILEALVTHLHAFVREVRPAPRPSSRRRSATSTPSDRRPRRATTRRCCSRERSGFRTSCACSTTATRPRPTTSGRSSATVRRAARTAPRCSLADARRAARVQGWVRDAGSRSRARKSMSGTPHRRPLREPGSDPGGHELARQVHDRRRRPVLRSAASSPPATRCRPTGRRARCSPRSAGTTCAPRTCISHLQARLQDHRLAGLRPGRSAPRNRQPVRRPGR